MPQQRAMFSETIAQKLQLVSVQFMPFLMAIVIHEYGHGWMARRWGDKTAFESGRLTLNPIPHLDPIGTILFPLINMFTGIPIMFGWAKPVPINPQRFSNYRKGLLWVSLAGPGFNFILAVLSAFVAVGTSLYVPPTFYLKEPFVLMSVASMQINFALGIFNLIPLPPLDGSKAVESFLSYNSQIKYQMLGQYSFFILLALMWSGALSVLSYPINFASNLSGSLAQFVLISIFGA